MKLPALFLLAACCVPVHAQVPLPSGPESSVKRPAEPGMKTPGGGGMAVEPPSTGNEEIVKKPGNVDPKIDDATGDIDRKNREQSESKGGSAGKGMRKGKE
ncbi:MAG TPA: hypothetical protein VIM12_02205 [Noviherbaspirillum sp.]|jgi:hypothetical protein|uniref:hypothetical protein n=1 Tax=Noviherbaspirillum sp. TaxID=1926288 RepID=UPI002F95D55F